ncbi:Dps family protein [Flavobacterium collinsii]|uniref:Non-specific DNA-binding protein Dps / Iron-binding ferritin-like antioxidant protein / Ferroxidase n=1 Tax=Flavobacterium collinsii TaxID=1114861 RepID=A0A9W4XFX0_9FLAO|nr:ferritin-like domain-containing protein [Flavobacterium collinsii]CAI2768671.1 Non-specific DNA-binding protein Dps / Iron-binding ferritin-like antioxidant protein / Ferroxidase [Flavobacterium collinsii]
MKINIGITESDCQSAANELAKIPADEYILYAKTIKVHWNVEGVDFYKKYKFFGSQFTQLDEIIDSAAHRIGVLVYCAGPSLKLFLKLTHLTQETNSANNGKCFLTVLLNECENIIIHLRENIYRFANDFSDLGSRDFLNGLSTGCQQGVWFLHCDLN